MANIITSMISFLNNDATVYGVFANRITADKIPNNQEYPHARIWLVSSPYQYNLLGEAGRKTRIQVDVYADTQAEADEGIDALHSALSGYKGMMGSVDVGRCFARNLFGSWNSEARNYHRLMEVEIGTND